VIEGYAGDYTMGLEEMYRNRCNRKECVGRQFANSCMDRGSVERGKEKLAPRQQGFVIMSILD
jgi:hypothetical protein